MRVAMTDLKNVFSLRKSSAELTIPGLKTSSNQT